MASLSPQESLWYEQSVNAGAYLGAIAYGLHVATVYKFIKTIMITSKRNERTKEEYMWISCIGVLFALGTVNISCIVHFNELAWIDMRNYPGGPVAFLLEQSGDPSNVGSIATATLVQTASGLVTIRRCHALWRKLSITIFLCLVLITSTVISILHCIQVSNQMATGSKLMFTIPSVSLLISLNILITLLLFTRLVNLRQRAKCYSFNEEIRNIYMSYEALVVESALPPTIFSLAFFILYGLNNPGAVLVFAPLVQSMAITAEMIIIRILCDEAWSCDMASLLARSLPSGRHQGCLRVNEVVLTTFDRNSRPPVDIKNHV